MNNFHSNLSHVIAEILLKLVLFNNQSINQSISNLLSVKPSLKPCFFFCRCGGCMALTGILRYNRTAGIFKNKTCTRENVLDVTQ